VTLASGDDLSIGLDATLEATHGTVTVGDDALIDGGSLIVGGNYIVNSGGSMTVQNGGHVNLLRSHSMSSNTIYHIAGAGSVLEMSDTSSGSHFFSIDGGQVNVTSGGLLSSARILFVGFGEDGTLFVDGPGSSVTADQPGSGGSDWGFAANATVTFQNNASGSFGSVALARQSTGLQSIGIVTVQSGADLNFAGLALANFGGQSTSATFTVTDVGSTVTAGVLNVGHASTGSAALNVSGGGMFSTGTSTTNVKSTGDINISTGGTFNANGNVTVDGGTINRDNSSSFELATGKTMTVQNGGSANFSGNYSATSSGMYNISGTNSKLETLGGGAFNINNAAQVNVDASGLLSVAGNMEVGNGSSGTLSIDAGASATQAGSSTLTVGHGTTGTATINVGTTIGGGASLTTGTGQFTINATGTVNVGGNDTQGGLYVNGDVLIDGGELNRGSQGAFVLAAGKTMTITNGGIATFTSVGFDENNYITASNGTYNIVGSGSKLVQSGDYLYVANGAQVNAQSGGDIDVSNIFVGLGGNGAVVVDGAGSTLICQGNTEIAHGETTGSLTFQNGSTGNSLGTVILVSQLAGTPHGSASLSVLSGSTASMGALFAGVFDVAGHNAVLNINGAGSAINQTGSNTITLGAAANSIGVINIGTTANGGTLNTGTGLFTINKTGTVNLGGGANTGTLNANGDMLVDGGVVNRTGGSVFALAAGKNITIQNGGSASFTGDYTAAASAVYNISGTNSKIETLSGGAFNINNAAQVNVNAAGLLSIAGNMEVGNGSSGTLSMNDVGASATQTGASTLTVGHATSGTGTINVGATVSGGTLTTGTGLFTIKPTGAVNIGSGANVGTLNANGDVLIDGGVLTRGSGSTFALASGKTMTIQNGGRATFTGDYGTPNATHNVNGSGSRLEAVSSSNILIRNGAQVNVTNGGALSARAIDIGTTGTGGATSTLVVDGIGSSVTATANSDWGGGGRTANVTFQNGATGTFPSAGGIFIAATSIANSAGYVTIQSGATITMGQLDLARTGAPGSVGTFTVTGAGSRVTKSGTSMNIGHASGGTATVTIADGGLLTQSNGGVTINGTGLIDIHSGGTFTSIGAVGINTAGGTATRAAINVDGAGSVFTKTGSSAITIGHATTGAATVNVTNGGQFTAGSGGTTLNATGVVNIDGGTVDLKSLTNNGGAINFTAGSLSYIGDLSVGTGGLLGSDLTLGPNRTLTLTGATTIDASHTLALTGGSFSTGSLAVNGTFDFDSGALAITGSGGLTIGGGGPLGAMVVVNSDQTLDVTNTLTVNAGARLILIEAGGLSAGTLSNDGDLVAIDSSVDGPVVNNSAVTVIDSVDFNGLVSGLGNFFGPGTANFNGGYAPGASPAAVNFEGNVAFGASNTLAIELGGLIAGSGFDQLTIEGSLQLGGTLDVDLTDDFMPQAGNTFDILNWGALSGVFLNVALPPLDGDLLWDESDLYTEGILRVVEPFVPGDFNRDGDVDVADFVMWSKVPTLVDGDYNDWSTHFGQPSGGSGGSAPVVFSPALSPRDRVPEPGAAAPWMVGFGLLAGWRRAKNGSAIQQPC
jgi:T5SS/PEP-CTERM-associated repeat protein